MSDTWTGVSEQANGSTQQSRGRGGVVMLFLLLTAAMAAFSLSASPALAAKKVKPTNGEWYIPFKPNIGVLPNSGWVEFTIKKKKLIHPFVGLVAPRTGPYGEGTDFVGASFPYAKLGGGRKPSVALEYHVACDGSDREPPCDDGVFGHVDAKLDIKFTDKEEAKGTLSYTASSQYLGDEDPTVWETGLVSWKGRRHTPPKPECPEFDPDCPLEGGARSGPVTLRPPRTR